VDLPQAYYQAYAQGIASARVFDHAMISRLGDIDSLEKPAVLADLLLRYDQVNWVLVSAIYQDRLILSLRSSEGKASASSVIKKLVRGLGQGGGHRHKAGGYVQLENSSAAEIERVRGVLQRRFLRAMGIKGARGESLVSEK
jgi:hypothetical protein